MNQEDQKFMALSGLRTWCAAAIRQVERMEVARKEQIQARTLDSQVGFVAERHFFISATWKIFEHLDWVVELGLFDSSLFDQFEKFRTDARLFRNKNEHVTEYFSGKKPLTSFEYETAEGGRTDASSTTETRIADRLDWVAVAQAARELLEKLPLAYWPGHAGAPGQFVWNSAFKSATLPGETSACS